MFVYATALEAAEPTVLIAWLLAYFPGDIVVLWDATLQSLEKDFLKF